jgi:hypothetical protein
MKPVGNGLPDRARAPRSIASDSIIDPVNSKCESSPQGARRHQSILRATGPSLRETRSAELRRLRRQRNAKRIWRLGGRVEVELVDAFIPHFGFDEDAVCHILDRLAWLNPDVLRALGAEHLPPLPIHSAGGTR